MIIISDTSVISNLIYIDQLEILQKLFSEIIIPEAVNREVLALDAFSVDLSIYKAANWIKVQNPINKELEKKLYEVLDEGESAAIALAYELSADYLAIDEKAGRRTAESLGIKIIGLIGILLRAKERRLIDKIKPFLDQLIKEAGFYIGERFYHQILADNDELEG